MSPRFQNLLKQSKNIIFLDSETDHTTSKIKEMEKLNGRPVSQNGDDIDFQNYQQSKNKLLQSQSLTESLDNLN